MTRTRRRYRSFIYGCCVLALSSFVLSACTKAVQPPSLVTLQEHQSGQVEAAGTGAYSNIVDRLSSMTVNLYPGSNTQIADSIANEGGPSKGVRVVLKGKALS